MYDPDMITACILLGTHGVSGRNFMGPMSDKQIDVKLPTLKANITRLTLRTYRT